MGCTINTSGSYTSKFTQRNKNLPTTIQSGSEILTVKFQNRLQSIKSSNSSEIKEALSATISEKALLPRDIDFIGSVLHSHFLFKDIDRDIYAQLVRSAKFFKLNANEVIFTQGNKGSYLFIIMKGQVEILINETQINILGHKSIFGELALMHDTFRTATAKTITNVELLGLERNHFQQALKIVAHKQYMDNLICIDKCELFSPFDSKIKSKLLEALVLQIVEDKAIVKEGEPGVYFYVIKSGKAELSISGKSVKQLSEGDYFGDQSLLNGCIRTATVKAVGKVEVLCFDPADLEKILGKDYIGLVYKNLILISLAQDEFLSKLMKSQLEKIALAMIIHKYKNNEVILKKGKRLDRVLVIVKGCVKRGENSVGKFTCIGSEVLIDQFLNECCCVAIGPVETAEIPNTKLEEVIGGCLAHALKENDLVSKLMNLPFLSGLTEDLLRRVSKALTVHEFKDEEVICRQYSGGTGLYIVQSGEVRISIDGEYVRTLSQGSYFGERAILKGSSRSATATAKGKTSILLLSKEMLTCVLDENIQSQLESRINLQDYSIELEDLSIVQFIGRGMFGSVFLSAHRETKALYAIKTISLSEIRRLKIHKNIKSAEDILLKLDSPFIMRLVKTLQDEYRVYFIQEFVDGKLFVSFLEEAQPINESHIKFYLSNMVLMLQHLNSKSIAHRDLKPENMIIDGSGYLKLIDFDTAKKIKGRSYTVAGTPHYMAPEMIKGNGYNLAVDYWSLGVILYEMVYGVLPFGEYTHDPLEIYHEIIEGRVNYRNKYAKFKAIIQELLEKNPGVRADYEKLKANQFFAGVKWEDVLLKKTNPPYKPTSRSVLLKDDLPQFCTQLIVEEELIRYKNK